MGRQYYDAISEIALLKGDVKPPRPRTLVEAESRAVEREEEAAVLEAEAAAAELERAEEAKIARRTENEPKRVAKRPTKGAYDHWGHGRVTDFGAGAPQGHPRARGVYLINQAKKE